MKKYLWMLSAAVVIGALRVNTTSMDRHIIKITSQLMTKCWLYKHTFFRSCRGFTWNIKSYFLWRTMKKYLWMSSAAVVIGALKVNTTSMDKHIIKITSQLMTKCWLYKHTIFRSCRGFTWNIKSYFLWRTMKKYLWMLSAAVVIGALRVNTTSVDRHIIKITSQLITKDWLYKHTIFTSTVQ